MEAVAKLDKLRISPRKVRLVADLVRGRNVKYCLAVLSNVNKKSSDYIHKLIKSAISNWEVKNPDQNISQVELVVKELKVDSRPMFKRLMTAPQGRGYRIRKRSSQIFLAIDSVSV